MYGIKKNSTLYKSSDIKLYIPEVKKLDSIVPTSSTSAALALGDTLAIASMECRKFGKLDFKISSGGNLGNKLKTVEDLMLIKNKIPFNYENQKIKKRLRTIKQKKHGV